MMMSLPARGAWVETESQDPAANTYTSLPARGAWVETEDIMTAFELADVAPRAGGVG